MYTWLLLVALVLLKNSNQDRFPIHASKSTPLPSVTEVAKQQCLLFRNKADLRKAKYTIPVWDE